MSKRPTPSDNATDSDSDDGWDEPSPLTAYALPGDPRGRHLRGLSGVRDVSWPGLQRVRQIIDRAARLGEAAAVIGKPGYGKTFACRYWKDEIGRERRMEPFWAVAPPFKGDKRLLVELHRCLSGVVDEQANAADLYTQCSEIVADGPAMLFIDEAQRMGYEQLDIVRSLHDSADANFALVLLGGHGCEKAIAEQPELNDRIAHRAHLRPLGPAALREFLNAYHPVYAATHDDLIERVRLDYARGVLRRWARFLQTGLEFVEDSKDPTRFTSRTVDLTLADLRYSANPGTFLPPGGDEEEEAADPAAYTYA